MENIKVEEVVKALRENSNGCLATVDKGIPRVRPFGFMLEEEGKFYLCTNSLKDVYQQLLLEPFVEYTTTTKEMVTIRISGKITFCEDIKIKEKVLNAYDVVRQGYKTAENPIFKVFYIEHGSAIISDFSGLPSKKLSL